MIRIHSRLPGTNTFQPSRMNWSYRNRGNVPRNQMNTKKKTNILIKNATNCNHPFAFRNDNGHGHVPPPRNNVVAIADTVTMLTYSARKNSANFNDEYSVWNPPTNSDSASGRSNGARLVSPTIEITNTTKLGASNNRYQPLLCADTMSAVDSDPAYRIPPTIDRPNAISYEITCAALRNAASNGYGEPDAHPPSTIPYTPIEEHASTTSTPTGRSTNCNTVGSPKIDTSPPNGITENATNAGIVEITGAMKYTRLSAITGMMSSLNASFSPSARLCSQPPGPTRFGPGRCCIRPTTLRSRLIMNSVSTTPIANSATTFRMISQIGSSASSCCVRVMPGCACASRAVMTPPPREEVRRRSCRHPHKVTVTGSENAAQVASGRVGRQPHDPVGQVGKRHG